MIATGTGEVTLADLMLFTRAIVQGGALSFPRIIDLSHATLALSVAEIRTIGQAITATLANGTLGTIGAVAFVAGSDEVRDITMLFEDRTRDQRPIRVCASLAEARHWIAGLAGDTQS